MTIATGIAIFLSGMVWWFVAEARYYPRQNLTGLALIALSLSAVAYSAAVALGGMGVIYLVMRYLTA